MSLFSETVKISDGSGSAFNIEISTPTMVRLGLELGRNSNARTWRPHFWGGDWEVKDAGFITVRSGPVWYRRSSADWIKVGDEYVQGDVRHLDIFLFPDGDDKSGEDDFGIALRSFFALNGMNSSGGGGYLKQPWSLKCQPGSVEWDIPGRYLKA